MTISIERGEISDSETGTKIENAIRDCIGARPTEDWKASIELSDRFCKVTLRGPVQTRSAVFYDERTTLPEKIAEWLNLYPLR